MNADDIRNFNGYLRNCTDAQVLGVHEKERNIPGHDAYVALAEAEATRRGLLVP